MATRTGTTATTPTTNARSLFASEDEVSLFGYDAVYSAWLDCRRNKRKAPASVQFEMNLEENLFNLSEELSSHRWRPSPSVCFVTDNGKPREIFAATFKDRIVHHLLIGRLRPDWERVFIHDSYSCRRGKGTHAAVKRLQRFLMKATGNRTGRAHYLQMDIRAFFNSIDKVKLKTMLVKQLDNSSLIWLVNTVLDSNPAEKAVFACSRSRWNVVEQRKSLFSALPGKGMPIGNLTSQFFANVYLNSLDQFVKHVLKAKYYIRYVDDFVIVHEKPDVLRDWRKRIENYLNAELMLECKQSGSYIRAVSSGINFLGYVTKPTHILIRRKTLRRFDEKLRDYADRIVCSRRNTQIVKTDESLVRRLQSVISSYWGMHGPGCSKLKMIEILQKYKYLKLLFVFSEYPFKVRCMPDKGRYSLRKQYNYFRKTYNAILVFQVGCYYEFFEQDAEWAFQTLGLQLIHPRRGFSKRCGIPVSQKYRVIGAIITERAVLITETGRFVRRVKERMASTFIISKGQSVENYLQLANT